MHLVWKLWSFRRKISVTLFNENFDLDHIFMILCFYADDFMILIWEEILHPDWFAGNYAGCDDDMIGWQYHDKTMRCGNTFPASDSDMKSENLDFWYFKWYLWWLFYIYNDIFDDIYDDILYIYNGIFYTYNNIYDGIFDI